MRSLLLMILVLAGACERDPSAEWGRAGGVLPEVFPMSVGNHWRYFTTISMEAEGDSLDIRHTEWNTLRVCREEVLPDGRAAEVLCATDSVDPGTVLTGASYYRTESSGLYFVGYTMYSNPRVLLKRKAAAGFSINGRVFRSFSELRQYGSPFGLWDLGAPYPGSDSLYVEPTPLLTFRYPFREGDDWQYRPVNDPFGIRKRVAGTETISTPAGSFRCYRVEILYDLDSDGVTDTNFRGEQFISREGLVKETWRAELMIVNIEGDSLGFGLWDEESVLTGYRLCK